MTGGGPLGDGVVLLRPWSVDDAVWYAEVAAHDERRVVKGEEHDWVAYIRRHQPERPS